VSGGSRLVPDLRGFRQATRFDLVAGLAVAALAVPQGMAYALVAGLPAEMGLLAAALPTAAAALFGSSPHLVSGPTNPIALLVGASIVGPAVAAGGEVPVAAVLEAGLLAGVFLIAFGLLDLGRASRFVSDSVISGFATGAGLLIALRQIPPALGVSAPMVEIPSFAPGSWALVRSAAEALPNADPRALGLALAVPLVVLVLRRLDRRIPGPLIALALATAGAWMAGWAGGPEGVALVGRVNASLPFLSPPTVSDPAGMAAPALAIALLATVQSIAAARSLPMPSGERFDPNRELIGQGVAGVVAAAAGALPPCGSLTRSALSRTAGGRSRLAPMTSGLLVAFTLPFIAGLVSWVPLAALAGLVVLTGLDLVNPAALRRASVTRGDAVVLVATLAATLWIDLVQAVYVGVLLALGLLLRRAGNLRVSELLVAGAGRMREIPVDERTGASAVTVLNLEGHLSFAVAADLRDHLSRIGSRGGRVIVVRLKRTPSLDATVLESLRRSVRELGAQGVRVILCGLTEERVELILRTGLGRDLGEEGLVPTGPRLVEGLERALDRARGLVPAEEGRDVFRSDPDTGWVYEI
jgi:SulP family sulfate permease